MHRIHKLVGELVPQGTAPPQVSVGASVADAVAVMRAAPAHATVVTDGDVVVGIFSERDLLTRVFARDLDPAATPVVEVMTADPVTLPDDASVRYAIFQMGYESLSNVPVVDVRGRFVGLVGVAEVIAHLDDVLADLDAASHVADPTSPWVDLGGGA